MLMHAQLKQRDGFLILVAEGLGAHHLGNGVSRAQLPADGAESQIGHPCHRGQGQL